MSQTTTFDYFYGMQAETYSFFRIPKVMFTDPHFKKLSCEAKVLYGLLLDRMSLSLKNQWFDAQGRVYIIFTIDDACELMGCSKPTVVKLFAELDDKKGIGLVEKKRLGLGKANILYVKNFMLREEEEESLENTVKSQKLKNLTSGSKEIELQEVKDFNFKKSKNFTSGSKETELQEVKDFDLLKSKILTSGSKKNRLLSKRNIFK